MQFSVAYRLVGDTSWTGLSSASGLTFSGGMSLVSTSTVTVSSTARKTLRCGIRWKVASGQYEVMVTRLTSTFTGAVSGGTVGDCTWSVLRSINPQLPSTTGTTKLAVRIKATDQLQGVV